MQSLLSLIDPCFSPHRCFQFTNTYLIIASLIWWLQITSLYYFQLISPKSTKLVTVLIAKPCGEAQTRASCLPLVKSEEPWTLFWVARQSPYKSWMAREEITNLSSLTQSPPHTFESYLGVLPVCQPILPCGIEMEKRLDSSVHSG